VRQESRARAGRTIRQNDIRIRQVNFHRKIVGFACVTHLGVSFGVLGLGKQALSTADQRLVLPQPALLRCGRARLLPLGPLRATGYPGPGYHHHTLLYLPSHSSYGLWTSCKACFTPVTSAMNMNLSMIHLR
jgi:hypothetical protein